MASADQISQVVVDQNDNGRNWEIAKKLFQNQSGSVLTALPSNPIDGQEIIYLADATNGVAWHLKYYQAMTGSYKWLFIGGHPLFDEVTTQDNIASDTYGALTGGSTGPTVTVPLAGDYEVDIAAAMWTSTVNGGCLMSYKIGGTNASANDAFSHYQTIGAGTGNAVVHGTRTRRKTGLSAATILLGQYRRDNGATAQFFNRTMRVLPIRVG